jgi:hypothetical protein
LIWYINYIGGEDPHICKKKKTDARVFASKKKAEFQIQANGASNLCILLILLEDTGAKPFIHRETMPREKREDS